ncbi:collagenase [Vibrio alginolyticus]|uniref:collagenase n=1 Tax=Vibrio alginolyticus TaxID=663 RepID=UPI00215ECA2C|nr:collagenase [Vibrio alginolyticus]MCS0196971.1 collagenase [Vibrio alginolyticus]
MELKTLSVAIATTLTSTGVFALSEPVSQVTEQHAHSAHTHGVESNRVEYQPTATLPIQPSKATRVQSLESLDESSTACDLEALVTESSNQLIGEILSQGATCVNQLFSAESRIQESVFSSDHMYNIAKRTTTLAKGYTGGGSDELETFFLYLRAGYYAEFYNDNISFIEWVTPAVKESVDAFVNNANFYENSDRHGKVLSEVIITMDSAGLQHAYLPQVTQWLTRWNDQYAQHWYMRNAVNGVFTILFGGQWNEQFVQIIGNQTDLAKALGDFALRASSIGAEDEFMAANAGRELGRLTKYTGNASSVVKSQLSRIFEQYEMYGRGDAVWLAAADTASYYADCSEFGICNFETELKGLVLSQTYTCSPTIRILSQNMTQEQHAAACSKMGYEEGYFHQSLETGEQPVKDDHNTQLQVNIFDSSTDYGKYAGPIFDISTDNGGMYLEGDPSQPGNIPNFIAYEASYANADHFVWNLEHEYVHYLDGRFDLYGGFSHPTEKIVWWSEGIAEYVAQENDNQAALETILDGSTYTLSEIFETTYDGFDVDRIYRWGYLAVRFMFENHKDDVNQMLVETRQGNWSNYKATITQWANLYQSEFEQWQQALVSNGAPNAVITANNKGKVGESITFSSENSTDPNGKIVSVLWDFGDGSTSTQTKPTHQYGSEGEYSVSLSVTDSEGLTATATHSVVISTLGGNDTLPQDCAVQSKVSGGRLTAGEPVCLANQQTIWLSVPAVNESSNLAITTGNGMGNLKLEYSNSGWPDGANLHGWSDNIGNGECIMLSNQSNYWGYVKVSGDFENAAIVVDFDAQKCRQ